MAIVSTSAFELLSRWHSADWPFAVGGHYDETSPCICFSRVVGKNLIVMSSIFEPKKGRVRTTKEKTPHALRTSSPVRLTQSDVLKRGTIIDDLGKVGAFFSQSWTWFSFRLPNLITVQKTFPHLKFGAFYCVDRTHTSWARYLNSHNLQPVFSIFCLASPNFGTINEVQIIPITESLILFALESRWNET